MPVVCSRQFNKLLTRLVLPPTVSVKLTKLTKKSYTTSINLQNKPYRYNSLTIGQLERTLSFLLLKRNALFTSFFYDKRQKRLQMHLNSLNNFLASVLATLSVKILIFLLWMSLRLCVCTRDLSYANLRCIVVAWEASSKPSTFLFLSLKIKGMF